MTGQLDCVLIRLSFGEATYSFKGWLGSEGLTVRMGAGPQSDIQLPPAELPGLRRGECDLRVLKDGRAAIQQLHNTPCTMDGNPVTRDWTPVDWGEHELVLGVHTLKMSLERSDEPAPDPFSALEDLPEVVVPETPSTPPERVYPQPPPSLP